MTKSASARPERLTKRQLRQPPVLAAGTVVMRGSGRHLEVLVVHRKLRADWSLPKGKLDEGELMPACAVRETLEETTVEVVLRRPVGAVRYLSLGRPKLSRYWLAVPTSEGVAAGDLDFAADWQPNAEVDEIRWVRPRVAEKLLTYPMDVEVLGRAAGLNPRTSPLILLRHAEAEKRAAFAERHGGEPPSDLERPLTELGSAHTPAIAAALRAYGVEQVHSSPARRCLSTVAPALVPEAEVRLEPEISEFAHAADPVAAAECAIELAFEPAPLVVVCHRPVLPTMVRAVSRVSDTDEPSPKLKPGDFLVFHRRLRKSGLVRPHSAFEVERSADQTQ